MNGQQYTPEQIHQSKERVKEEKLFPFIRSLGINDFVENFDPKEDPMLQKSVLTEAGFADVRQEIRSALILLRDLVEGSSNKEEFKVKAQAKAEEAEGLLEKNLENIAAKTNSFKQPLSELSLYIQNTSLTEIGNLTILALNEKFWENDPDDELFNTVAKEVENRAIQVDQENSIGYVVMPKFANGPLLGRLADVVHRYKTTLISGYRDLPDVKKTLSYINVDQIGGPNAKWGNVMVVSNTAITANGLHLSPASALAGRLHMTKISQPIAGLTHGTLSIDRMRYNVNQDHELPLFKKSGVIPLVGGFKANMAYGNWSAFKGQNDEIRHYAVVRVLNWISRSLRHHLNKCTFELTGEENLKKIKQQVSDFLSQLVRFKIIKSGNIRKFEVQPGMQDVVHIELDITPLYSIRGFAMTIDATNGNSEDELS